MPTSACMYTHKLNIRGWGSKTLGLVWPCWPKSHKSWAPGCSAAVNACQLWYIYASIAFKSELNKIIETAPKVRTIKENTYIHHLWLHSATKKRKDWSSVWPLLWHLTLVMIWKTVWSLLTLSLAHDTHTEGLVGGAEPQYRAAAIADGPVMPCTVLYLHQYNSH